MDEDEVVVEETTTEDSEIENVVEEIVEEIDPLTQAIQRAEAAEKEISYRDAEIQNVRKRLMSEKASAIQYGGMGMARKMLNILNDIDRALSVNEDEGLALIRSKMWSELSSDGVTKIETKGGKFDPTKMEAITTLPPSDEYPANSVIDELESGYMYKDRVLTPARVVVSSDQ
ncbi:MAG: nucleotide exchange factor GrpE [Candidatus Poseidoniales archaeon]|nr:MAG: nucleotide exchange factor GrpE [Candidatus Poseidoniales archaeon]|tara:strand:+ start:572 stop:1090 length:519 start_codon:yes stop_codon:yes gene_type:complete